MEELKTIVVAMGGMTSSNLRDLRGQLSAQRGNDDARELVINLIDLYIQIGDNPSERAAAAMLCLRTIDAISSGSSGSARSSVSRPSASPNSGAGRTFTVLGLVALGGYALVAFFGGFWPFL